MGYLTLLGRRRVDGTEIEVEMFANVFYGNAPVEARVLDDGRVATVDHRPDRATLLLWNPDGTQISGIELGQGWFPSAAAARRGFHLAGAPYRIEGGTTTREVEGVRVNEPNTATWTLPVAGGVRELHLNRNDDGTVRTWWQG
ncbi:hypothetical protein EON77_17935 [bacterium]|nr:MAG: hypothetical protein EON77_17935 [bacterium]